MSKVDMSKYKIIFVHGLASKPPAAALLAKWQKCLIENIGCYDSDLAREMRAKGRDLFHMAYWANVIPSHIENEPGKSTKSVNKVIKRRKVMGKKFHVANTLGRIKNFWKRLGVDAANIVTGALSVKDDVAKRLLVEVNLYWDDQYIAESIREEVEEPLRKALSEGRQVAIICHSMGTFITYDVLWRFSHHRYASDMWGKRTSLLITIGSPLGDPMIKELMLGKRYGYKQEKAFPTNIDYWVNLSALGDIVCHDQTLTDDYFKKMKEIKALKGFREYVGLFNPYYNEQGKINPHSSCGYLLQPKLAKTMLRFFGKIKWD